MPVPDLGEPGTDRRRSRRVGKGRASPFSTTCKWPRVPVTVDPHGRRRVPGVSSRLDCPAGAGGSPLREAFGGSVRRRSSAEKLWVGWREWVGLPALGIDAVKAKVDTGALTSALHAVHIHRYQEQGRPWVAFDVHPVQRDTHHTVHCTAPVLDERLVSSSTGHRERRIVIRTPLVVGEHVWPVELTLTNRDTMGFRMLLGRRAMRRRLVVNPAGSYLAGVPLPTP